MFNLQGSEIIFILLLALVVLGPEKLPGAIKRAMHTYAELRKLGTGFQAEFKSAIDEPLREMRETANLIKEQADPKKVAEDAERAAEAAAAADRADAELMAAGERSDGARSGGTELEAAPVEELTDPFADPIDELDELDPVAEDPILEVDEDDRIDELDEPMEESA